MSGTDIMVCMYISPTVRLKYIIMIIIYKMFMLFTSNKMYVCILTYAVCMLPLLCVCACAGGFDEKWTDEETKYDRQVIIAEAAAIAAAIGAM